MTNRPMHLIILGIGSLGLLWAMLDSELDGRGAILFVRPYHVGGLVVTVITGVVVLAAMLRLFQRQVGSRPVLQTTLFFLIMALLWWRILPLGDWLAEQVERAQKSPAEVGDMGYGWYYGDDSGMGGDPMSIGHLLRASILYPFIPMLWLAFVYLVLRLRASSKVSQP